LAELGSGAAAPTGAEGEGGAQPASQFSWVPVEIEEDPPSTATGTEVDSGTEESALTRLLEVADELRSASERMRATMGRATSLDEAIEATVDSQGHLVELRLDPKIRRSYTAEQIGPAIAAVIQGAEQNGAAQRAESWSALYADADPYPVGDPAASAPEHG
jgi:hypothetical protein